MAKKSWELEIGEPTVNPVEGDVVLNDAVSQRKRKQLDRQEQVEAAEHSAKMAKLKKEETSADAAAERTGEKREETGGIKVEGSVKLGTIDFQKQQEELREAIANIQHEHEEQIKKLTGAAEGYRDQVHDIQYKMMEQMMEARMDSLKEALDKSLVKPESKTFSDQITEINNLAGALGFKKVSADDGTPASIRIDMMRLDMDEKARERDFQRQMKTDERMWQLKLEEIKGGQLTASAKIQAEKEKTNMLAALPETLGRAIGKGMIDSGNVIQEQAAPPKPKRSSYSIEAGEGEAGETTCPNPECGAKIAIAPTARTAACPGCNMRIPIKRMDRRGDEVEREE